MQEQTRRGCVVVVLVLSATRRLEIRLRGKISLMFDTEMARRAGRGVTFPLPPPPGFHLHFTGCAIAHFLFPQRVTPYTLYAVIVSTGRQLNTGVTSTIGYAPADTASLHQQVPSRSLRSSSSMLFPCLSAHSCCTLPSLSCCSPELSLQPTTPAPCPLSLDLPGRCRLAHPPPMCCCCCCCCCTHVLLGASATAVTPTEKAGRQLRTLLKRACFHCHT